MRSITAYERRQIRQALEKTPRKKHSLRTVTGYYKPTDKERGCSYDEGRYEQYLVESAIAEATQNRPKSVNH